MRAGIDGTIMMITAETQDEAEVLMEWMSGFLDESGDSAMQIAIPQDEMQSLQGMIDTDDVRH